MSDNDPAGGPPGDPFASIPELEAALAARGYIAGRALATALYLSWRLPKPLFLEGEAGVGKTEVARTLAAFWARG